MLVCGGNGVRGADVALGRRGLYGAIGSGFCRVEEIELRGIAAAGASERRNGEIGASRVDEDGEFLSVASDRNLPTKPNQKKKRGGQGRCGKQIGLSRKSQGMGERECTHVREISTDLHDVSLHGNGPSGGLPIENCLLSIADWGRIVRTQQPMAVAMDLDRVFFRKRRSGGSGSSRNGKKEKKEKDGKRFLLPHE